MNGDISNAYYAGLMQASGYRRKDLDKPVIGIVNSWNDVNPGSVLVIRYKGPKGGPASEGALWLL